MSFSFVLFDEASWKDVIDLGAGIVTAGVALLVYLEARSIRRIEWFSKTAQNWQDFNRLVLDTDISEDWSKIIEGELLWSDLKRKHYLVIYSFLNVLVFEFNAQKNGLLSRAYAQKSVGDNILYFKHIWPELFAHLSHDGWSEDFLSAANKVVKAKLKEEAAAKKDNTLQSS